MTMQTYSEKLKFVIFLWELTYFVMDFTNVLWLWNVFCLKLTVYVYCLYDVALWSTYNKGSQRKLSSCYNKCAKLYFGFKRFDIGTTVWTCGSTQICIHMCGTVYGSILWTSWIWRAIHMDSWIYTMKLIYGLAVLCGSTYWNSRTQHTWNESVVNVGLV